VGELGLNLDLVNNISEDIYHLSVGLYA